MRPLALPSLVLSVLLLSACGSASNTNGSGSSAPAVSTSVVTTATTTTTPPTTPATTTTSGTTSTPTATTETSVPPPCRAADLSLAFLGGEGATGHGELGFELRNASGQSCSTVGYPGIQFLDKSGGALPTTPTHTTDDFFGSVPKLPLTVGPGAIVSFRLGVTHGAASSAGCTTAYGLQVIPPNDTATLQTSIPHGAYECETATVSPLAQGTAAYTGPRSPD